jgi:GT2 family glycosyltransferase
MVDYLCDAADKYPDFGIFGPEMCYSNKEPYMHSQKFNLFIGITTRKIAKSEMKKEKRPLINIFDKLLVSSFSGKEVKQEIYETDGVPNVFMIRKEVLEKCNYFDEKLIQTFTEMDFSLHAMKMGYKSGIVPLAKTFHQIEAKDDFSARGLGGEFNQKAYCLMRNRSIMIARYGTRLQIVIYLIFFSWFWPLVYSVLNLKRTDLIKLYLRGYLDGIYYFFSGNIRNTLNNFS